MKLLLASPRGFCAGVDRAIEIVDRALEIFGSPIYVRNQVVHNRHVVEQFTARGTHFIDVLDEVPDRATLIFSAHGVSRQVREEAHRRQLRVLDATCPLVTKVHLEVARHAQAGREVILIGHAGHPEVVGTMGQYYHGKDGGSIVRVGSEQEVMALQVGDGSNLAYVTQTTLSVDDAKTIVDLLKMRYPNIVGPRRDDICYATQNRQDAVKLLAEYCDVVLVVGSQNSSNSNRLREVAERMGRTAYLIDSAQDLRSQWLEGVETLGLTAGASAPELLVQGVIERLRREWEVEVEELISAKERVSFSLPKELL